MISITEKVKFAEGVFGRAQVYAKNMDVKCPFCDDSKKRRLSIRLEDDVCHCWVCGFGSRTLLPLLIKFGTREQINEYKTRFIPELPGTSKFTSSDENVTPKIRLPSDFKLFSLSRDAKDPETKMMIKYCEARGLTDYEFWYWRLGFSNQGILRRRVIIPSFGEDGEVNYYAARTIDPPPHQFGKYKNADCNKNEIVFNELNIDWSQRLVIVEGPFDLMKCKMNATCILGSSISTKSLLFQKILEHETPIVLMLDDEMQKKTQEIGRLFTSYKIPVFVTKFTTEHDPGEMSFDKVSEYVSNAIPWTWTSLFSQKLVSAMNCNLKLKL